MEEEKTENTEKVETKKEKKVSKKKGFDVGDFVGSFFRMLLKMVSITFWTVIVTFFIAIFNPEGVTNAIEILKGLF